MENKTPWMIYLKMTLIAKESKCFPQGIESESGLFVRCHGIYEISKSAEMTTVIFVHMCETINNLEPLFLQKCSCETLIEEHMFCKRSLFPLQKKMRFRVNRGQNDRLQTFLFQTSKAQSKK